MQKIQLDVVVSQRKNRTDGFINYGQKADLSFYQIPVIIIEGGKPGKTLLVDGAMHGDETEGSEAIIKLAAELEGQEFNGTFIGVPALNMEAFTVISRATIVDGFNLNRVFPGRKDQYTTHYLAAVYMERVVQYADAVINFHGGGDVLHLEPLCAFLPFDGPDDKLGKVCYEMAKAFNVQYLWSQQNLPFAGITSLEYKKAFGIPTIIPEVGSQCSRLHNRFRDIEICYNGIKNVMAYFEMIPPTNQKPVENKMHIELNYLHSRNGGFMTPIKKEGELFEEGDLLCVIDDLFGRRVEEIYAPWKGVVIGFWSVPVIHPGDWCSLAGRLIDPPADYNG